MHSFMINPVIQNLKAVKTPELKAAISTLLCHATCSPFLVCSICHDIPRRPFRPQKCAHVMCFPCLQQFVKSNCNIKNLKCPRCRIEFDPADPAQIICLIGSIWEMHVWTNSNHLPKRVWASIYSIWSSSSSSP